MEKFLRWTAVRKLVGISRVTAWRLEKCGRFPKRRKLGSNSVAWLEEEILQWVRSRPSVINDEEKK